MDNKPLSKEEMQQFNKLFKRVLCDRSGFNGGDCDITRILTSSKSPADFRLKVRHNSDMIAEVTGYMCDCDMTDPFEGKDFSDLDIIEYEELSDQQKEMISTLNRGTLWDEEKVAIFMKYRDHLTPFQMEKALEQASQAKIAS